MHQTPEAEQLVCNNTDCDTQHRGKPGDTCPTCVEGRLVRGKPIGGRVKIREITHHGDFRHERIIDVPAPLGTVHMADILMDGPYPYPNAKPAVLAASLRRTGEAEHAWTTWSVVWDTKSNVINLPTGGNA